MWQRFTERARCAVYAAQEEATALGVDYVGPEHLLLGLIRDSESVAAVILDRLGVPLGGILGEIQRQAERGGPSPDEEVKLTLTRPAKRVIDLAYEEARQLNNNYIGTEHLLLGLAGERKGMAGGVLAKLGADVQRVRAEVQAMQALGPTDHATDH